MVVCCSDHVAYAIVAFNPGDREDAILKTRETKIHNKKSAWKRDRIRFNCRERKRKRERRFKHTTKYTYHTYQLHAREVTLKPTFSAHIFIGITHAHVCKTKERERERKIETKQASAVTIKEKFIFRRAVQWSRQLCATLPPPPPPLPPPSSSSPLL